MTTSLADEIAEAKRQAIRYSDPQEYARLLRMGDRIRAARAQAALADAFRTLTPAQAADWIETNVTSLATAKTALKIMARILVAMRDQIWPDLPE